MLCALSIVAKEICNMFNIKWLFNSILQFVMALAIVLIIMAIAIDTYYPNGLMGLIQEIK